MIRLIHKIPAFVLALFVAAVFVSASSNTDDADNAGQTAAPSYPTPTIETADEPAAGNQSPGQPAVESPAVAQFTPDTAKVVFQVDGMSCSGCISTIKSSLDGHEGIRDVIVNISGGTAEVYKVSRCRRFSGSVTG